MALLAVGCGSARSQHPDRAQRVDTPLSSPATPAPLINPDQPLPAPGPTGMPAATTAVGVIRAWSDALRRGDVRAAAGYFALPSVMVNGTDATGTALVITIGTTRPGRGRQRLATVRRAAHLGRPARALRQRAVPPDRPSGPRRHRLRRRGGHHGADELRDRPWPDRGVAARTGRSGR